MGSLRIQKPTIG